MSFISSWGTLIKRFIGTNVIFSSRATKLAGINDFNSIYSAASVTFTAPNIITFVGPPPLFLQTISGVEKIFKITGGGGPNNGAVFRLLSVAGSTITVSNTAVINFSGAATLDGRIWKVIDDDTIARSTSTGSTMYNVHNRTATALGNDASEVAYVFAEHYHLEPKIKPPVDEILFHQYNEIGERSMVMGDCSGKKIDIGPLCVVDNCGNAVRIDAELINPVDSCYPYPDECPGETCKVN